MRDLIRLVGATPEEIAEALGVDVERARALCVEVDGASLSSGATSEVTPE